MALLRLWWPALRFWREDTSPTCGHAVLDRLREIGGGEIVAPFGQGSLESGRLVAFASFGFVLEPFANGVEAVLRSEVFRKLKVEFNDP